MGMFFPKALQPGTPISTVGFAKALQKIAYALEYMAVDGGFITWSNLGVPTIHIDAASSRYDPPDTGSTDNGSTDNAPKAWDVDIDGADVTCSECVYMRGPVTLAPSVDALTLALDDSYIAAHINLADGTVELVEGSSISAVTDAEPLDDDTTYKLLLYHVVKTSGAYNVSMRYCSSIPQLGVRL
jgi:hypothetical protein